MRTLLISLFVLFFLAAFAQAAVITPFSSPENSYQVLSGYLSGLDKSAYIEVYTFTNLDFADRVVEARNRGVDVITIVDGNPAGEKVNTTIACYLEQNNIPVYLHKRGARYMHAKYIVGDNNSAAILSENFGPDGSRFNRGWGDVIEESGIDEKLGGVFAEDLKNSDRFYCQDTVEKAVSKKPREIQNKKFIEPEPQLILAPDAVESILALINSAEKSLYIEQFYIYKEWKSGPNLFLEAAVEKARKGVDVKVLMDSNYYNTQSEDPNSNYNTAEYIKNISRSDNISLDVKLADLGKLGLSKIHNKGAIIDNKTVLISSINWNENSPRKNREIGIVITGESAGYFLEKFWSDWNSGYSLIEYRSASGKFISKDHLGLSVNIVVFIILVSIGMLLIKRWFYSK